MRHPSKWVTVATVVALVGLSACGSSGGKPASVSTPGTSGSGGGAPERGGTLTVLVPSGEWPNIDPAHDTQDTADAALLNSVYGGLFKFGTKGQVIPDLATGYSFSKNGLTVDISLRHGLKFSDGTPVTADDVAWSITRALDPKNACICDADFAALKSVTASGPDTVVLTLSRPFWSIIEAFNATAPNWIVDKAALEKMGTDAYQQTPVAAGPFKVVSNKPSTTLHLTANPSYWDAANHPYVKDLIFTSVGTDQSAYAAVQAGQAQAASAVASIPIINQLKSQSSSIRVITGPALTYQFVSLNDKTPPFNNIVAREALYYATDANALVSSLYKGLYKVVQSPTTEGMDFYLPTVPGYRTYDLAKAKALVKQLGGLHVDLATTTNSQYFETEVTALKSMWARANIQTNIVINNLEQTLNQLRSGSWQALDSNWGGAVDPAPALPTYFESDGPFTGIHDPTLDHLIDQAAATKGHGARLALYKQVAERMSTQAEAPFLYEKPFFTIASGAVQGISSAHYPPYWENAWVKK